MLVSVRMGRWCAQGLMCCRHSPTPAHHPLSGTLQAASFHPPTVPLYREGNWGASAQKCPKSESLKTIFRPESLGLNCDQHIAAVGPRQSQGVGAAASPRPVRPCSVHGADSQQPALRGQDHPLRPLHRGGLLGSSYSVSDGALSTLHVSADGIYLTTL